MAPGSCACPMLIFCGRYCKIYAVFFMSETQGQDMIDFIREPYEPALRMLGKCRASAADRRPLAFTVREETDGKVLYFNTLTREMIAVSKEDESSEEVRDYLDRHWFFVPEKTDDIKLADQVLSVVRLLSQQPEEVSSFTVFTTTDCNARCFYCFENGCERTGMTEETADAAADYMIRNAGDHTVKIQWFGGEPLMGEAAIDRICGRLRAAGKKYRTSMISNGYLFDDENVRKAACDWNLKKVQITLDGTEEVYNRAKAYIYKEGSPYRRVMENIGRLLRADIRVAVRLNLDLYNAENLLELADELSRTFGGQEKFSVYGFPLFEEGMPEGRIEKRRKEVYGLQKKLDERLGRNGILAEGILSGKLPVNQCMADSGRSVTILPDGRVGLCEHFTDREIIGDIWHEERDLELIRKWKVRRAPVEACRTCVLYPECYKIERCPDEKECFPELQRYRIEKLTGSVRHEYGRWLKAGGNKTPEAEEPEEEAFEPENC